MKVQRIPPLIYTREMLDWMVATGWPEVLAVPVREVTREELESQYSGRNSDE